MKRRLTVIAAVAASLLVLAACGESDAEPGGPASTPVATTSAPTDTTATTPADPNELTACLPASEQPKPVAKESYSKAEQVLTEGAAASIVMKTSCGTITIALDEKAGGPIPNSLAFLTTKKFFDGLTFHRVVPDFVLQGGDPLGNGTGGPGYQVEGPVPAGYEYKLGDVAMAKTQTDSAGTAGSQFFIVSGPQGEQILTSQPVYGILGHANDPTSLATIKRIADLAVADGPPSQPVWIISATLKS